MDGLADYSRNSGYVKGDVTLTNETVTFNYDRGRKFSVDNMDNEETAGPSIEILGIMISFAFAPALTRVGSLSRSAVKDACL